MDLFEILVILVMIGLNGVFAAYEIALASVSAARLQVLAREKIRGARAALYMKENFEASLATVQLGITLLGAIAAATGGAGAEESIKPYLHNTLGLSWGLAEFIALTLIVVPITVVTILFGELAPKIFAIRNKEAVCLQLSRIMRWIAFSLWPAVWLLESAVKGIMKMTERKSPARATDDPWRHKSSELQTLRASVTLARASRLIGERQEGIILRAAMLSERPVKEIMLPAAYISMMNIQDSIGDSLIAAHLDMHTRFPVSSIPNDPQSILGYINLKDIMAMMRLTRSDDPSLRAILRPFPRLMDTLTISACLERLIREHTHIALVVDTEQNVVGMITLEDILEELVGEIEDEYDRLPAHILPTGQSWIVGGGTMLQRIKEQTGIDLSLDPPPQTAPILTEWVSGHLGRAIRGGDELERNGIRIVVRKIRRQKILEAQLGYTQTLPITTSSPVS